MGNPSDLEPGAQRDAHALASNITGSAHGSDAASVVSTPLARGKFPLRVRYLPSTADPAGLEGETALAEIHFGGSGATAAAGLRPTARVAMEPLGGSATVEVWTSSMPVRYGEADGIQYAAADEFLFGVLSAPYKIASDDFVDRVQKVFRDIFALIAAQDYPHLLRMWNYFPDINGHYDDLENYQRFCRGRAQAFQERYGDFNFLLPSACALGTGAGPFVVYFIASRSAGVHRENPRQVSAYRYPPQYGQRSPSFARATLTRGGEGELLFISGTASIVGHQSLHAGDVRAQLDETFHNIEALVESTAADEQTRFRSLTDIDHLKVYLRRAADMDIAREFVERRIGAGAQAIYLVGDVCRRELLVEVEAVLSSR